MSKFDIYAKVSILINYNSTTTIIPCMTHLPDLLTWQICWPSDLDLYFALHWLTQFTFTFQIFSTIRCTTTKPCIVLLLDVQTWQVPWPGEPALVAQLVAPSDWRPGGRGFNPRRGRQHSFVEIMKYFLRSFSPFRWFKKGSCQFLAKECAQYWLTA